MEKQFALRKIMVCLDLTEMDESLIRFTSYIAKKMDSDRIYFVHVAPTLDMPEDIRKKYPDLFAPVDERLKKEIEVSIKSHFEAPENCSVEIEVREGNPSDKILKIAEQKDIDLLVLGRKNALEGGGVLTGKLARIAHRSVLLVPEILPQIMDRLLVPVDFSDHSFLALQQAVKIQETSEIPMQVTCLHVYKLPSGWHTTGKTEKEFAAIMKGHAEKDYEKFLQKLKPEQRNIPCEFVLNEDRNMPLKIYKQAIKDQSDLIILGSKGKTAAASVLMGSTTEKLSDLDKNIPLLVVKEKNENISFLQALFKI